MKPPTLPALIVTLCGAAVLLTAQFLPLLGTLAYFGISLLGLSTLGLGILMNAADQTRRCTSALPRLRSPRPEPARRPTSELVESLYREGGHQ